MSNMEPKPKYTGYLFEYRHAGTKWGLTIPAVSEEDAIARIHSIQYATLLGTEVMRIPVKTGMLPRLICWLRNGWCMHASPKYQADYGDMRAIPRRSRLDQNIPAELAIRAAIDTVEETGAHPLLTDAVVLLQQAREKVADYVDGKA